jgi:hypothetical protein
MGLVFKFSDFLKIQENLNSLIDDKEVSKKYNFHIIPDGKENNYRSAQFPEPIIKYIYKKYGKFHNAFDNEKED